MTFLRWRCRECDDVMPRKFRRSHSLICAWTRRRAA
jgi:hypothetical protein